jgi:heat shock protein HslJ
MQTRKLWAVLTVLASVILAGCRTSASIKLDGTNWVLSSLNGQAVLSNTQVTINFVKDVVNGSDGCNSYSSTYTLKGSQFRIDGRIIGSMMACQDPIMKQATAYHAAMQEAVSVKVDGQQLTLLDAKRKPIAIFKK